MLLALSACRPETNLSEAAGSQRAIQNKGSDTLVNVALAWAETYQLVDPKAAQANGIDPVEFVVAVDALAVIVHPNNPVSELTIAQLSDIFSGRTTNWKEMGGNDGPIVLVSRETNSGTHVYFLEEVVRRGASDNEDIFAPQTLLMPSSVGISSEIRRNPNAIGYDGLGYVTEHEKVIALATDSDSPYVVPSRETAADSSYPLARNLFMYTAGEPTGSIDEYLDWIMSPEGQIHVGELGFVPLPED
jgi:phosphate transport system substrate-binding protein